jgi:antitoxin component YwqK of YwqJK toxin-antitoxin module
MSGDIQSGISDMKKPRPTKYIQHHKDGSIWARGQTIDGVATGYWEWFRKDGVRMRSGYFEAGAQVGEWTTYDRKGNLYNVTTMKPKAAAKKTRAKK